MKTYRLYICEDAASINAATTAGDSPEISFMFTTENGNYLQFKQAINEDTAQLEVADGVLMTAEEAKAFVATLP